MRNVLIGIVLWASMAQAETVEQELLRIARASGEEGALRNALVRHLGDEKLKAGTAAVGYGPDFLFAIDAAGEARIMIDDGAPVVMRRLGNSGLQVHTASLATGRSHAFEFLVAGRPLGKRTDVSAYGPDSYPQAGVVRGTLLGKFTHSSRLYPGMVSDYWVYASPGVDRATPAAFMVWQDGQNYARENSNTRLFTVTENLVHQKKLPPMVYVMISPGLIGERRMRSVEYDAVNDLYVRFLLEEILPEVEKHYRLRTDAYSRGVGGESSGGICAFNVGWQKPEAFARVLSRIGSYTSIQWGHEPQRDRAKDVLGGNAFPFLVRKEPKRNLRVWLEDGNHDLENSHGSWPLQNIQMANSLKMREYDFHFSFGNSQHNTAHGNAELPAALAWLWREYEAGKTAEEFVMEAGEKERPYYRVGVVNR